jgi:hypothetical protein
MIEQHANTTAVQRYVSAVFADLAATGPRPFGSIAEAQRVLTPGERCSLRNKSASARLLLRRLEADHQSQEPCAQGFVSACDKQDAFPECDTEHEARGRRLLSQYQLPTWHTPAPDAQPTSEPQAAFPHAGLSHLAHADLASLLFVGDSVTQQLFRLAQCELQRDAAAREAAAAAGKPAGHSHVRVRAFAQISEKSFAAGSALDGLARNLSATLDALAAEPGGGARVVVATFPALHLNAPAGGDPGSTLRRAAVRKTYVLATVADAAGHHGRCTPLACCRIPWHAGLGMS